MANIKQIGKKQACVIGGSGFIASLLIKQLLQKGYAVNTTVRDLGSSLSLFYYSPLLVYKPFIFYGDNSDFTRSSKTLLIIKRNQKNNRCKI